MQASTSDPSAAIALFAGPGAMRARCRELDWAGTPLGPVESWSPSLRTAATSVLDSALPMIALWGPDLVQIYNDAYVPFRDARHPGGLGQPTRDRWPDVRHINATIYERVAAGETVALVDALFPLERQGSGGPRKDLYVTLSYSPIPAEPEGVGGVLIVLADTTAQVAGGVAQAARDALELELRGALLEAALVLDQVRDAYMLMDAGFNILRVNQSAERMLGMSSPELVGRTHWDTFPGTVGGEPERQYRRVVEERVEAHFVQHYTAEGYGFHVEIDAYPTSGGGIALFWRDVSERISLLEGAEHARAEAEAANRSKSDFLAVMSHELRTPLNAILGYVELIEMGIRGPVSEAQRVDLARIRKSQRHLLGLINGVLDYAKVDAGAVRYELEPVPLHEVLASCEALVLPQARAKRIELSLAQCDQALAARADREKLQQIVLNMLSNAVKFTDPDGSVTLTCDCSTSRGDSADPGGRIHVRVSDTGVGIAPHELQRVFQPFVQVDAKLTRTHEGTGLGLAISRDLSRGMGGDLTVESTLGVGSIFTLELPAA